MPLRSGARFLPLAILFIFLAALPASAGAASSLSVGQAYEQAKAGQILLIDIRSREEWRETGVATVATPISMHEDGFLQKLDAAVGGDHGRAIAFICAQGVRSAWMQAQLLMRGYTNVINVPQGMLGSSDGPGWIADGLPVTPFADK